MTNIRTFAPAAAIVLVVAYSLIATASSGALVTAASPLLIAAIAVAVWHSSTDAGVEA